MNKKTLQFISFYMIALLLMIGVSISTAAAQATTTIGAPTTGAGGDASINFVLLISSLILVAGGAWYALSAQKTS